MKGPKSVFGYICYFIFFIPVFFLLCGVGLYKGVLMTPIVFIIIGFGDGLIIAVLFPVHLFWSLFCILRTKKFGPYMKCLLLLILPIPIVLWTIAGLIGSSITGLLVGFGWPFMETFRVISKEGVPICMRVKRCFTEGLRSSLRGACTIVRDFKDFSFHSFFSVTDELMKAKGEEPIELKVLQIPGCFLAAFFGILVDVPVISVITLYKAPILLFKGWYRLVQDLIGREGPFLETMCVPFAGLWILLWPFAVVLAIIVGILSSFGYGCYAAVVAYQESSTWRGLLYVVASAALFDEYTNDLLYLREGSCFPRPRYREHVGSSSSLPRVNSLHEQHEGLHGEEPLIGPPSVKTKTLQAVVIWDGFIKGCGDIGKELLRVGAIGIADLDAWKESRNKIVNIGIPAYAFLECFLYSIKSGSPGFLLRDNVEITHVNRPEGRIFDWLYEPMSIMKEQIRRLNLEASEELYFYKYCLYSGDASRIESWQNGGVPPQDEIKRAQLEGIARRLQGFCLTLSRMPTSRRRFFEVVKAIEQEEESLGGLRGGNDGIEAESKDFV
ncbi:hypothetical protein CEY00_Acc31042 [Actinidia chinensis var. chinensis]|uniref:Transmembrane protein n=1 Tax=Actinidia chinensis var. chinensis TaxID=1590841 RepID=A0A2R6PAH1_ACTCC|nr:hypothetical protein CEY00_Acc31042 [Actinidia chinensis var. chinensis]